jgi:hypothetical protein
VSALRQPSVQQCNGIVLTGMRWMRSGYSGRDARSPWLQTGVMWACRGSGVVAGAEESQRLTNCQQTQVAIFTSQGPLCDDCPSTPQHFGLHKEAFHESRPLSTYQALIRRCPTVMCTRTPIKKSRDKAHRTERGFTPCFCRFQHLLANFLHRRTDARTTAQ